jgi:RNA polymerase sigma-70 factor (ECF subfamily)
MTPDRDAGRGEERGPLDAWTGAGALEERVRRALARGDTDAAATEMIRVLGPEILAFLRRVMAGAEDAQDAFALFTEDAWRGLPGWRGDSSLRTWAFRVARHAAAHVVRDPWRRHRERLGVRAVRGLTADPPTPGRLALDGRAEALARMRGELSGVDDLLLVLRVGHGLSWQEVASALSDGEESPSAATLRKRFERLKDRLAQEARSLGLLGED